MPTQDNMKNDQGLLTICAWTKSVKVGNEWWSVEKYLLLVHGLVVSHGICPSAAASLLD